ncbi:hypothetical protein Tco_0797371 [Tanacetum coccineum]
MYTVCIVLGKDNGENIMKSIKDAHVQMGTVLRVITGLTRGYTKGHSTHSSITILTLKTLGKREDDLGRNKAAVQDGNVVVQDVRGRYNATIMEDQFRVNKSN